MEKFIAYGIGNALLDYEYLVDEDLLEKLELQKGTMLLNEFDKHTSIHTSLKKNLKSQKIMSGGSVANSIYAMAKFGNNVCFSGKVSNDDTGNKFIKSIEDSGIHSDVKKIDSGSSGECLVLITPDNERTMNTYLGSSSMLEQKDISKDLISDTKYLLVEGYLVSNDKTLSVCNHAIKTSHETGGKVVITLSDPNIVKFFRNNILSLLEKKIEFIFCNEQEAYNFSEVNDLQKSLDYLKNFSEKVIVTLGAKGVVYSDDNDTYKINGNKVDSKDFTGAGDMFLGAFMHYYTASGDIEKSLEFANTCAAEIIRVYGAKFDQDSKYENLLNQF